MKKRHFCGVGIVCTLQNAVLFSVLKQKANTDTSHTSELVLQGMKPKTRLRDGILSQPRSLILA